MAIQPLVVVVFALISTWLLRILYRGFKNRTMLRGLPQPPHSFIFGHLKVMGEVAATMPPNNHPQAYLTAIARKYNFKGIFYLDLWPVADSMVVLNDPALMSQVTIFKDLPKHPRVDNVMAPTIGRNNIASSNGLIWKKTHSALAPTFSWSHIRNLTGAIIDETLHFRNTLDRLAKSGEVFSFEEESAKLIFDVTARLVFNVPLYAQTKGSSYLNDIREMIRLAESQLSWDPIVQFKTFFRRQIILRRLHPSLKKQIVERYTWLKRENVIPSRKDPFSILDLMLRDKLQETGKEGKPSDLEPEFMNLLVVNIKALLLGGHGTTTDTICFIYMLLSKSPDVLQKLRDEHTRVFAADFDETVKILRDSPSKLNELTYTTAVIQETLRLFPVGFGVREAAEGATLTYNSQTYPISGGLVIVPNGHDVHYNPQYFDSASKFLPSRFADPENPVPRSNFWTFGHGPRACMGLNLAQDELRIIMLMTVRDYDFECANIKPNKVPRTEFTDMDTIFGDIVFQELSLEAKPRGGMMMRVKRR